MNGESRVFDGYSVQPDGNDIPGVSLTKGSQYASVAGDNIQGVFFSSDGRLRDITTKEGGGSDLELYFGTNESLTRLDMLRFNMRSYKTLQVFDTEDNEEYKDCIVMRTDGLANGFDFTFYNNELISNEFRSTITKDSEYVWIKIQAFTENGQLGVKLWTAASEGLEETEFPDFANPPDFVSPLYKKSVSVGGGSANSNYDDSSNEYSMKEGSPKAGEIQPDGSLVFDVNNPRLKEAGACGKP